jgi:UDP-N-acetyl-2-amino-2-deoxyglucuronate dehydrogenase
MKNFVLIGAAGFIAPRHLKAIKDTNNNLVAALDYFDSVGIMDSYFPSADFFTEFERFDRHLEKAKRAGVHLDFTTVCTPNYLHDAHIRFGMRVGTDVICEKPLVLNPWNVEALETIEKETNKRVYNILQLRLHPALVELKKRIDNDKSGKIYDVDLTYLTSRGHWYYASWKGDVAKSGGIATNIGIHFFDMLCWIFGPVKENKVHVHTHDRAAGFLGLEKARVRWFLSIDYDALPEAVKASGKRTYRSLTMNGEAIEFSDGFTELHSDSYRQILAGEGFGLASTKPSISVAYEIRNATPIGLQGDYHPFASQAAPRHPFNP